MPKLILICLIGLYLQVVVCFADEEKNTLAELIAKDDNSHWCCKVDTPVNTHTQTRVASHQVTRSRNYKCGSRNCGFLGLFKCTVWCTEYWFEIEYYTDYYTYTQSTPCPESQVTCCVDYFNIMGHCFHITEVQSNLELLNILNQQGIVVGK